MTTSRLTALAISLLAVSSAACTAADVEADDEQSQELGATTASVSAHFNTPTSSNGFRSAALFDELGKMVDATPPGETIRASMYTLGNNNPVVEKLVAAKGRGVHVQIVVDRDAFGAKEGVVQSRLKGIFGTDPRERSWIRACGADASGVTVRTRGGCNGDGAGGKNHNKLVLFSRVGADRFVTWVGSTNLTSSQLRSWNSAVVFRNDRAMYRKHIAVWDTFVENIRDPKTPARQMLGSVAGGAAGDHEAYFAPDGRREDALESLVKALRCDRSRGHFVSLSMHEISNSRVELARSLARSGCRVEAVASLVGWKVLEVFRAEPRMRLERFAHFGDEGGHMNHNKFIVVHADLTAGKLGGRTCSASAPCRDVKYVLAGSHNWSDRGLEVNDESMVRVVNEPRVFAAFRANLEALRAEAKTATIRDLPRDDEWGWCTADAQCASGTCEARDGGPANVRFCR